MEKKVKRAESTIELIKHLDYAYDIHPNKPYIQGMIMGLATTIYGNCEKPKCIPDELWEQLLKQGTEELDANERLNKNREKFNSPKSIKEALGYEIPEETDEKIKEWEADYVRC